MNKHPTTISTPTGEQQKLPVRQVLMPNGEVTMQAEQNLAQLSDEEFWGYARTLAHQLPAAQPEEWVTCKLYRGSCLIPLAALYEIVRPPHRLALLPAIPEWMPGVIAWRGETIAVIDLDEYLSGYDADLPGEGILLVANYDGLPIGLFVPSIGQITPLQSEEARQLPSWYLSSRAAFVKDMQGETPVLDLALLLADVVQQIETAPSYG